LHNHLLIRGKWRKCNVPL